MGLFGSLVKLGFGGPPGITRPEQLTLEGETGKALDIAQKYTPMVQSLEKQRREFLTAETDAVLGQIAPWLSTANQNIGAGIESLTAGKMLPGVADEIGRRTAASNFSRGLFGQVADYAQLRNYGIGALAGFQQGVTTAESWGRLMASLYAPVLGTDYSGKYLPSTGAQAQFDVNERNFQWQAKNLRRQFNYATDPMRGVEEGVAGVADVLGTALSVYLGGLGGGMAGGAAGGMMGGGSGGGGGGGMGSMLGGLFGMGSGGGGASGMQFLQGIYSPAQSASLGGSFGESFTPGRSASYFGFGGRPTTTFDY